MLVDRKITDGTGRAAAIQSSSSCCMAIFMCDVHAPRSRITSATAVDSEDENLYRPGTDDLRKTGGWIKRGEGRPCQFTFCTDPTAVVDCQDGQWSGPKIIRAKCYLSAYKQLYTAHSLASAPAGPQGRQASRMPVLKTGRPAVALNAACHMSAAVASYLWYICGDAKAACLHLQVCAAHAAPLRNQLGSWNQILSTTKNKRRYCAIQWGCGPGAGA
jgi:hypothetical protein